MSSSSSYPSTFSLTDFLFTEAAAGTVEGLDKADGAFAVVCDAFAFWVGAESLRLKTTTMVPGLLLGAVSGLGR